MIAFCYASGQIGFGASVPDGALPLAKGPRRALMPFVSVVARHSRTDDTLLVPGIPEAENQTAALDALLRFSQWIGKNPPAGVRVVHSQHRPSPRSKAIDVYGIGRRA